ncbi:hypothetical protein LCGC14_0141430 [marine sediment metagenome]|uniref:Uncharacterized protein n=1 Tax=marine sediment metagenome TaxID=412755 RepID=A0A0F9XI94_9ZZZZ
MKSLCTQLSDKDAQIFLEMLQDDSEPNEALKAAAIRYVSPFGGDAG